MRRSGISLFELLVSMAIVAILVAIVVPVYLHYQQKARYAELVQAADRYKPAVVSCIESKPITDCDAGTNGIPAGISSPIGLVASVTVVNGVITVTPTATYGFTASDTYIATPTAGSSAVTWTISGGACSKYVQMC